MLRENEDVIIALNKELEGSLVVLAEPGTTVAKIQSRLLSSKFLSIQVATSLEALKVLLNPALKQNESENNTHAPSDKDKERPTKLRKETSRATLHSSLHSTAKALPRLNLTNQDANMDMEGWESGSIDEGEFEEPNDSDIGPDDTLNDEEDAFNWESESEDHKKTKSKPSKPGKADKSSSSKNESTFLPSLSVGFVRGGSDDSDWSETEGKDTDLEPRKNRRGQRARRAWVFKRLLNLLLNSPYTL